jgi:hypothetical protein
VTQITATDVFLWVPEELTPPLAGRYTLSEGDQLIRVHGCPTAVIVTRVTREMLDPMAQGICRYCREPLDDDL